MGGAEPTVTINTKEALDDVFGMYNSPEKTHHLLMIQGSPLKDLKRSDNVQDQNAKTPNSGTYFF